MKILVVPDKFKGSLTAQQVCDAVSDGLLAVDKSFDIIALPLADGGEGTCELLTSYSGGSFVPVMVRDPLFRTIESGYGLSRDGKIAFLEMAKASGLQLLKKEERDPRVNSTAGTGDLIRHALDKGVEHIIMGIGGSATNDGGMGMAQALGVVFYSASGEALIPVGGNMRSVRRVDLTGVHPGLKMVRFTIFCDVDNPLHGPQGATYVFAPQKGASEKIVEDLDEGLKHYEKILAAAVQRDLNFPGAGAGGGLPASVKALADITIKPGMEFIIEFTRLEEQIQHADAVITGEGKVDGQTLSGKVVMGIAGLCTKFHKRLVIIAGKNDLDPQRLETLGATKLITLVRPGISDEEAIKRAYALIIQRTKEEIAPLFL